MRTTLGGLVMPLACVCASTAGGDFSVLIVGGRRCGRGLCIAPHPALSCLAPRTASWLAPSVWGRLGRLSASAVLFSRVALLASCGNRRFRDGCDAGNGCRGQPFMCRRRRCRHPCCRLPWCGRAVGRGRVTVIWRPPPHRQVSGGQPPDCSPHDIIPLDLSSPTLFYRPSWRRWFPHALCVARQPGSGTAGWGKIQPRVAVWASGRSRRVLGCPSGPSGLCPVRVCSAGGGVSLGDVGRGQATFGSGVAGKRVSPAGHALARRVRKGGGRSRVSSV